MKYRKFGKLDWNSSALGFGAMRLPVIGADRSNIDEALAIRMIRYAIDHGVNYVDTGYRYHNGASERVVGKALRDGYREKVRLATKMPVRLLESTEDLDRIFRDQLGKLQTDHLDFYLLHGLRASTWPKVRDFEVLSWAEQQMADGRIGHLGFSFHDEFALFKEIIDSYEGWTFCQIQYNYVDTAYQAGTRGLRYAAAQGLAVVVMEPIQGGNLAFPPPKEIQTIWDEASVTRTPAEWALQWVWDQPEVSLALSGMSTMDHVVENLQHADRSGVGILTAEELSLIARVREKYLTSGLVGCTGCRYCVPCPEGVAIPDILTYGNTAYTKLGDPSARQAVIAEYEATIPSEERIEACVRCGECEEKCPQHLPVPDVLRRATKYLRRDR